ncbi:MAG: hypothetical protein ACTHOL_14530 [Luteibacter jiangsuensis]
MDESWGREYAASPRRGEDQHRLLLRAGPLPVKMLGAAVALLFSAQSLGTDFCAGFPNVYLTQLSEQKAAFVGKRVRTEGVLTTDVKEWGHIQATTDGPVLFGLGSDDEAQRYRSGHGSSGSLREVTIENFYSARRRAGKPEHSSALADIVNFRQKLDLCGRVIVMNGNFLFVIDDFRVTDSYFAKSR